MLTGITISRLLKALLVVGLSSLAISMLMDTCSSKSSFPKTYFTNRDSIFMLVERLIRQDKPTGTYTLQQCIPPNDPLYQFLKRKKIIQRETKVIITAKDCITLQTRKQPKENLLTLLSGSQYDFEDILITYNGNEGDMLCSVNNLYSLNQDEHNGLIRIVTTSLNGYINISKVRNY